MVTVEEHSFIGTAEGEKIEQIVIDGTNTDLLRWH